MIRPADADDGRNLVLHEFAHQLDFEDGSTDGTPLLESSAQARSWADSSKAATTA